MSSWIDKNFIIGLCVSASIIIPLVYLRPYLRNSIANKKKILLELATKFYNGISNNTAKLVLFIFRVKHRLNSANQKKQSSSQSQPKLEDTKFLNKKKSPNIRYSKIEDSEKNEDSEKIEIVVPPNTEENKKQNETHSLLNDFTNSPVEIITGESAKPANNTFSSSAKNSAQKSQIHKGKKKAKKIIGDQSIRNSIEDPADYVPRGLPNLGNTCFANSIIQCLFHINTFRKSIINQKDSTMDQESTKLKLLTQKLFYAIENKHKAKKIRKSLDNLLNSLLQNRGNFQDAFDFLLNYLEKLDANSERKSQIIQIFQGKISRALQCPICNNETNPCFYNFPLNIPQKNYNQELIETLFYKKFQNGPCNKCNKNNNQLKNHIEIISPPEVLIIRLDPNYDIAPQVSKPPALITKLSISSIKYYDNCKEGPLTYVFRSGCFALNDGPIALHYITFIEKYPLNEEYFKINDKYVNKCSSLGEGSFPRILFYLRYRK